MLADLETKRDAIAALCRKYGVVHLYVFGSALRNDLRAGESHLYLLVEFGPMEGRSKAHAYFDLLDALVALLGTPVDLVMVGAVKNRYIASDIEATKEELYAA